MASDVRDTILGLLGLAAAAAGIALFVAALEVNDSSLLRSPLSLFGGRYR